MFRSSTLFLSVVLAAVLTAGCSKDNGDADQATAERALTPRESLRKKAIDIVSAREPVSTVTLENVVGYYELDSRRSNALEISDATLADGKPRIAVTGIPLSLAGQSVAQETFYLTLDEKGAFSVLASLSNDSSRKIMVTVSTTDRPNTVSLGYGSQEASESFATFSKRERISPARARELQSGSEAWRSSDVAGALRDCTDEEATFSHAKDLVEAGKDRCLARMLKLKPEMKAAILTEAARALVQSPNIAIYFEIDEALGASAYTALRSEILGELVTDFATSAGRICTTTRFESGKTADYACRNKYAERATVVTYLFLAKTPLDILADDLVSSYLAMESTLSIREIGAALARPTDPTGVHRGQELAGRLLERDSIWTGFNPAAEMKLSYLDKIAKLDVDGWLATDERPRTLFQAILESGSLKLWQQFSPRTTLPIDTQADIVLARIQAVQSEISRTTDIDEQTTLRLQARGLRDVLAEIANRL